MSLSLALSVAVPARAQDDETFDQDAEQPPDESSSGEESSGAPTGEPAQGQEKAETPGSHAWSFGPYFRFNVVPSFMLKLFLDEAPSPTGAVFGAMASHRSNSGGPTIDLGLGYASYAFTGPFRAKGGVPNDTEWIDSSMGLIHVTGSILWEAQIAEPLTFLYGVGLDLGVVTGELKRTEAYQRGDGSWAKCSGPMALNSYCQFPMTTAGIAAGTDAYDVKGEQYNVVDKSVPPVMAFPMLPHLALRYTPIEALSLRVDAAYGIAQFWFGLSAAYAPKM